MSSMSLGDRLKWDVVYGSAGPFKDFEHNISATEHGLTSPKIVASKLAGIKSFIMKNIPERSEPLDLRDDKIQELFTEALNHSIRKGIYNTLKERKIRRDLTDVVDQFREQTFGSLLKEIVFPNAVKPPPNSLIDGNFMAEDEKDFVLIQKTEEGEKLLNNWKKEPSLVIQGEREQKWIQDFRDLLLQAKKPEVQALLSLDARKPSSSGLG